MSDSLDPTTRDNIRAARTLNGIPPENHRVPFRNLRHALSLHATATPDKLFLIHYDADGERETLTFAAFNGLVHQAAGFLYNELGVRRGDRVATFAYNHSETVILYFACWLIGAAVVPQNVAEDDARIAYILRSSGAEVCCVPHELMPRVQHILDSTQQGLGASNIQQIVIMGGDAAQASPHPHFMSSLAAQPNTFISTHSRPTLDDQALLVYTSGTTGAPKGVVLNQSHLLADAQAIAQWHVITGGQRMMCVLPIHHVNGIVVTLITPLVAGASVVLNRSYSSSTFWQRIAEEGVHIVSVVPTLLQFSLDFADAQAARGASIWGNGVERHHLRHFRHFTCGAGTLSMTLVKAFEDRFGFPIMHGYGLSETTCYSCFLPIGLSWEEHQHWLLDFGYPSIGCPLEVNEMAIFDAAGEGRQLSVGERGEICIRGHNVMRFYDQRPDANREAFKFGWFRSGDEGFFQLDAQGRPYFFITGRIKELINRGGVKFSPFDIEEVLLQIPGVKVGLAIAFPNDYYGEEVGAYVVLNEGVQITAEAVLAHCRSQMTFEKSPKVVVFGTEIPVTSTGKYQRLLLRDRFNAWKNIQFQKNPP